MTTSDDRLTRVGPQLTGIAVVLSFAAGATDAFAFLQFGGIFTANMTGNMILAGLFERPDSANTLVGASVAVVFFAAGVFISLRIARPGRTLRRGLLIVLTATVLAQVVVLIGWLLNPHPTELLVLAALIAPSALGMAGQTSVARRIERRSGVTTTFMTGTLTSLMAGFADRKTQDSGIRIGAIVALVLGAVCAALLMSVEPALGAALPLLPSVIGLVLLAKLPIPAPA
jgi:uncharacterized membrane protein YoaK (UPF0700 family)